MDIDKLIPEDEAKEIEAGFSSLMDIDKLILNDGRGRATPYLCRFEVNYGF